jgi:GntR family transcriptional repressor for pyruvate dehydrogenase complex
MFRVSRTVVREALSTLAGRGLVEVKHGKGVFVAEPTGTSILDPAMLHLAAATDTHNILEARMVIEVAAAELAATRATAADLDALQTALDQLAVMPPGSEAAIAADAAFHQAVARASRNPIFAVVVATLTETSRHATQVRSTRPGEYRRSLESHAQILAAIRERNPLAAKRAMHEHLAMAERSLEWSEIMRRMRDARPPVPSGI